MRLFICYLFFGLFISCSNNIEENANKTSITIIVDSTNSKNVTILNEPDELTKIRKSKNYNDLIKDSITNTIELFPMLGRLDSIKKNRYYPALTDTIKEIATLFSQKVDMNPGNGIIVTMLHNGGTFNQMIFCTHDNAYNLIDSYYVGKSTMFDGASHTIRYNLIDNSNIKFEHVDWGYTHKDYSGEIDTINYYNYILEVNSTGRIIKKTNGS